jgi:hypothetical protein
MRIFKTRVFARFAKTAGLTDKALLEAAHEVADGLVDAELGGNLFKKRVALLGGGRRGGARTILVHCKSPGRIYFLYGFEKSAKETLTSKELTAYRKLEKEYSKFSDEQLSALVKARELEEIKDGNSKKDSKKTQE